VERIASFLAKGEVRFGAVKHSGKTRARQTAEILAKAAGNGAVVEAVGGIGPNDPPEGILPMLEQWGAGALIVGHLPFMGRLMDMMLGGPDARGVAEFGAGTVACLQWQSGGRWTLRWMLNPELFPGED
jgi:phosphohistidine phosphatase